MRFFDKFNDQGLGKRDAFEKLCCQLFESWGKYQQGFSAHWDYRCIRGDGGDGGIEAYWHNADEGEWIGIQAKWFPNRLTNNQYKELRQSIESALKVRPSMRRYIVCIPHNLTSNKNIKGDRVSRGEDEDWNAFKQKVTADHPSLHIDLWDEYRITSLINKHESDGCWRFWFSKSEINPEDLRLSVKRETARLNDRYTPEITCDGGLSTFLDSFFGSVECRRSLLRDINSHIALSEHIEGEIDSFLDTDIPNAAIPAEHAIACRSAIANYAESLRNLRNILAIEPVAPTALSHPDINYAAIGVFQSDIYNMRRNNALSNHTKELDTALDQFHELPSLWEVYRTASDSISNAHCIIIGDQGTGKTCGLASKANDFCQGPMHVPILVLATDFKDGDSWYRVIKRALGIGEDWDQAALWQALSAYAAMGDIVEDAFYIRSKVAIMVDGLDENQPTSNWEQRIREGDVITAEYPRIRFAYTSRPWGVDFKDDSLLHCRYDLEIDGDIPAWKLFDQYVAYYHVDTNGNDRYKWQLNTPAELRMLCNVYRNRQLPDELEICLTALTNAEISRLDEEFAVQTGNVIYSP